MSKKGNNLNKGARIYVESALSAASHPLRREILKHLKEEAQSATDLEDKTNEDRYNLYHHLGVLEKSGLIIIDQKKSDGKLKYYKMNYVDKPAMAAFSFDEEEISEKSDLCNQLFELLQKMEDYPIPKTNISKIEVYFTYDWNKK